MINYDNFSTNTHISCIIDNNIFAYEIVRVIKLSNKRVPKQINLKWQKTFVEISA